MAIKEFRGEYRFLSSMFEVPEGIILPTGEEVPTVEHAYNASKFSAEVLRKRIISETTGAKAKRKADQFRDEGKPFTPNWTYQKVDVMRNFVYQKFTRSEELGYMLIDTGDEEIIEGNNWRDTFWGKYPIEDGEFMPESKGLNWLGRILMETRSELQAQEMTAGQLVQITK